MSYDNKTLFIAIPFTGTTTIKNVFENYSTSYKSANYNKDYNWNHEPSISYFNNLNENKYFVNKNMNTFSIVRNPYDRLYSFYTKYLISYINNNINNKIPNNKKWILKNNYIIKGNFTFKKFITDFLISSLDKNNILYETFLEPYLDYWLVDNNKKIIVKDIYKLEEIKTWYNKILIKYFNVDNNKEIMHKNKRNKYLEKKVIEYIQINFHNKNLKEYGIEFKNNNYNLISYKNMYDEDMIKIVENIYKDDLEYFNYKL